MKNPSVTGGTGNFMLRTLKGENILDENLIFGTIGIANDIGELSDTLVSIHSGGLSSAGEYTTYLIRFKNSQLIPLNSYFTITVPVSSGYEVS